MISPAAAGLVPALLAVGCAEPAAVRSRALSRMRPHHLLMHPLLNL